MLSDDENKEFSEFFIKQFLVNGFGSLPKSEIDLVVFHQLITN